METIELKNQEDWIIFHYDEHDKIQYVFTDEVYSKLESIIVSADFPLDYPFLAGPHLNAPNLRLLGFRGEGCRQSIRRLNLNGVYAPTIEGVGFEVTGITQVPDFILNFKTIKDIHFRLEKLIEMPAAMFDMIQLQTLRFQYGSQIAVIPDAIKNLVNLEYFDFWGASIQYLSSELFRLPKLVYANFTDSSYHPSKEVEDAVAEFKSKNSGIFFCWQDCTIDITKANEKEIL